MVHFVWTGLVGAEAAPVAGLALFVGVAAGARVFSRSTLVIQPVLFLQLVVTVVGHGHEVLPGDGSVGLCALVRVD